MTERLTLFFRWVAMEVRNKCKRSLRCAVGGSCRWSWFYEEDFAGCEGHGGSLAESGKGRICHFLLFESLKTGRLFLRAKRTFLFPVEHGFHGV